MSKIELNDTEITNKSKLINIFEIDPQIFIYEPHAPSSQQIQSPYVKIKPGSRTCVSSFEEFLNNFHENSFDIFKSNKWDFSDIIVSGGYIVGCLTNEVQCNSDIDLWICGDNHSSCVECTHIEKHNSCFNCPTCACYTHKIKILNRMLFFFTEWATQHNRKIVYSKNCNALTLCIENFNRNIQIIISNAIDPYNLTTNFHSEYVESFFDGKCLFGTIDFVNCMKSKMILNAKDIMPNISILKAINKGYSFKTMHPNFIIIDGETNEDAITRYQNDIDAKKSDNKYYYPQSHEFENTIRLCMAIKKFFNSKFVSLSVEEIINKFNDRSDDSQIKYEDNFNENDKVMYININDNIINPEDVAEFLNFKSLQKNQILLPNAEKVATFIRFKKHIVMDIPYVCSKNVKGLHFRQLPKTNINQKKKILDEGVKIAIKLLSNSEDSKISECFKNVNDNLLPLRLIDIENKTNQKLIMDAYKHLYDYIGNNTIIVRYIIYGIVYFGGRNLIKYKSNSHVKILHYVETPVHNSNF